MRIVFEKEEREPVLTGWPRFQFAGSGQVGRPG